MSTDSTTVIDPFDTSALDEETELRALARAIQFSDKFALLFARCNQPQQRERVIERLKSQLPQLNVQEIHFTETVTHLLDTLRERIRNPQPDVIFVSGLEYSLPVAADAYKTQFVANLNAARNSFPTIIQSPLVLWMPEYALTAIARGAPDFFSIRSGVYFFASAPAETADEANSLTAGGEWNAWNLSLAEKQERIAAIESLLADYKALPTRQRDYRIEMELQERLGNLLHINGKYTSAHEYFESVYNLARKLSSPEWEASALNGLGNIYLIQNRIEEGIAAYQQSLEIVRRLGHRHNEAQGLINLGSIFLQQSQQEKAEEAYKLGLQISREIRDRDREAGALQGLGVLYIEQDKLKEAEKLLNKSVLIARETKNQFLESINLINLGNIFDRQGRLEEARDMYQQGLEISKNIGFRLHEGQILCYLAKLLYDEGRLHEALGFAKQSVAVFEKTEDAQLLEGARKLVRRLEQQLQEQSSPASAKE